MSLFCGRLHAEANAAKITKAWSLFGMVLGRAGSGLIFASKMLGCDSCSKKKLAHRVECFGIEKDSGLLAA